MFVLALDAGVDPAFKRRFDVTLQAAELLWIVFIYPFKDPEHPSIGAVSGKTHQSKKALGAL